MREDPLTIASGGNTEMAGKVFRLRDVISTLSNPASRNRRDRGQMIKFWDSSIKPIVHDRKYLPRVKKGQYSVTHPFMSQTVKRGRDWKSIAQIRSEYPTRNIAGWGLPVASQPTSKDKLISKLIKKTRRKSGKTYYQRAQVYQVQPATLEKPFVKKYVKDVDFGYPA